jgi:hypothetical protein
MQLQNLQQFITSFPETQFLFITYQHSPFTYGAYNASSKSARCRSIEPVSALADSYCGANKKHYFFCDFSNAQ